MAARSPLTADILWCRLTGQSEDVAVSYSGDTETDETAATSFIYNADSNLKETIDPDGHAIVNTFDSLNRETEQDWYASSSDLADPTETIHTSYNLAGQATSTYDNEAGYSYSYDTLARLIQIDNLGGETHGTPGVPDVQLNIAYYADGSQLSLSATIGSTADFINNYDYNAAGWLTSITQQGQEGGKRKTGQEEENGSERFI